MNSPIDNPASSIRTVDVIRKKRDGQELSPAEIGHVRSIVGSGRIVVPGIRRPDDEPGDQQRVATPEAAVAAGATHVVVGRPITEAADPAAAYGEFLAAMA